MKGRQKGLEKNIKEDTVYFSVKKLQTKKSFQKCENTG